MAEGTHLTYPTGSGYAPPPMVNANSASPFVSSSLSRHLDRTILVLVQAKAEVTGSRERTMAIPLPQQPDPSVGLETTKASTIMGLGLPGTQGHWYPLRTPVLLGTKVEIEIPGRW